MGRDFKTGNLIAVIIGLILAVISYVFYEKNIVLSIVIFLAVGLIYRKYIKNKKFKRFGDGE
ncbi:hypothetical protein [uncultured Clostridium sp.]|uniref:hypothetical protein n=1 Tax=uncultured Clostridium sp. TaxID=59620 RepID=UPI002612189D|nr:hypothetical protein [uncultured Clostridium sp.]